jgi:hypothetical protein
MRTLRAGAVVEAGDGVGKGVTVSLGIGVAGATTDGAGDSTADAETDGLDVGKSWAEARLATPKTSKPINERDGTILRPATDWQAEAIPLDLARGVFRRGG